MSKTLEIEKAIADADRQAGINPPNTENVDMAKQIREADRKAGITEFDRE